MRYLLAASALAALAVIAAPTVAAVTITATPAGYTGSSTDLFDVSQGTTVVAVSPYHSDVSDPANAIGGTSATAEPGNLVFADGIDTPQTLTFRTSAPVTIGGFDILLAMDAASNGSIRGFSSVSLAGSADGVVFTTLATAALGLLPYDQAYGSNAITVAATFAPTTFQFFQFTGLEQKTTAQTGSTGGRVVEIDAVGSVSAVPEPASWALLVAGFGLAGAALRRRERSTILSHA